MNATTHPRLTAFWRAAYVPLAFFVITLVVGCTLALFIPVHGDSEIATFTGWQMIHHS